MPQPSCEQAEFPSNFLPIVLPRVTPSLGGGVSGGGQEETGGGARRGKAVLQGTSLLRGKEVAFHFHTEKLLALLFPDPCGGMTPRAPEILCTD